MRIHYKHVGRDRGKQRKGGGRHDKKEERIGSFAFPANY